VAHISGVNDEPVEVVLPEWSLCTGGVCRRLVILVGR
jgi:hypothetical protein